MTLRVRASFQYSDVLDYLFGPNNMLVLFPMLEPVLVADMGCDKPPSYTYSPSTYVAPVVKVCLFFLLAYFCSNLYSSSSVEVLVSARADHVF